VKNFHPSHADLGQQIDLAYKRRGGVVALPDRTRERAVKFTYCGCISPFPNKADRFHIGRFTPEVRHPPHLKIGTSVMRECCQNVLLTPLHLSYQAISEGLAALKQTRITRATVREFIAPHLPSMHHRSAVEGFDGDLFEIVDVLTAMGRAERINFMTLGLFAGLLMTNAASVDPGRQLALNE
jgi:hypothetical protein